MPRPKKWRKIAFEPKITFFKPCGVPKSKLKEVQLKMEELEAMRLKDIVGLNQLECAEQMSVSRQTFQLIIESARKKVTEALTEAKGIHITGGNYTYNVCHYVCSECQETFIVNYEGKALCPKCGSEKTSCDKTDEFCRHNCCK